MSQNRNKFKVIVIGSGPGGCIPATLLAERGVSVLMLEAGEHYRLSDMPAFSTEEMQKKYQNGGVSLAFGKSKIAFVEGRCAGGGSEVNSGLYHRIPPEVLVKWAKTHQIKFDEPFLQETYAEVERDVSVNYMPFSPPKASLILQEGCEKLGWEAKEIPRWHDYKKGNVKASMTETYLPRFLAAGGDFRAKHRAVRIEKTPNGYKIRCEKTPGDSGAKVLEEFEADYIFLAAGAVNSAVLLQKSGLKRGVGRTLSLHPSFKYTARFSTVINEAGMGVPVHQVKTFSPELSFGCSISSYAYVGLALADSGNLAEAADWQKMANYYSMISPEGKGTIRLLPFFQSPFVSFSMTERDYRNLRRSYFLLAKLLFSAGATELYPSVGKKLVLKNLRDVDQIDALPKGLLNLMTIHLFCSVPMGGSTEFPVNTDGELRESPGLFVTDASVLCSSPSVNPQGAIMAIATMNAKKFINRHIKNEV